MSNGTGKTNEVEKKRGAGPKKILIVALIVIAVLALSFSAAVLLGVPVPGRTAKTPAAAEEKPDPYRLFGPLDFTVNLADTGGRRYLKVTMSLAYEKKALAKELEQRKPQIRNLIIEVLRNKAVDNVVNDQGTDSLRQELIRVLNDNLVKGAIADIYFTDLLIQ